MANQELLEAALENFEVFIDQYIDNEVVKDIPILGTALKVVKAAGDIRDRVFAAKIGRFLSSLDSVPSEKKEKLRLKMQNDPEEAARVGEIVLLTIERLSDLKKPELIAKIFLAYVDEFLKVDDFRRIVEAIDLAFVDDLEKLFQLHKLSNKSQEPYLRYLARTGLTEVVAGQTFDEAGKIYYELTKLGTKALKAYRHGTEVSTT